MKKVVLVIALVCMATYSTRSLAQFSVNVSLGNRCEAPRYEVAYYYLPEIEAYYDTYASVYIYYGPRGWMRSRFLPDYCRDYDVVNGYRVALDYRGNTPFDYFERDRARYYAQRNYREAYYARRDCRRDNVVVVYEDRNCGRGKYRKNKHWRRDDD